MYNFKRERESRTEIFILFLPQFILLLIIFREQVSKILNCSLNQTSYF